MANKLVGIGVGAGISIVAVAVFVLLLSTSDPSPTIQTSNEKIGLVINSPDKQVTIKKLDEIFTDASSTGIGRSNVYLFWNTIEPERGEFDWSQSDVMMGLNEKNDLKVTLFFSVINGEQLGPFPDWIGKPSINSIGEDRLIAILDEILSRYHIVDYVIIGGDTESQFRYYQQNIPVYKTFFSNVYEKLKEKHPDVSFGNSFALHHVLNKDLTDIVTDLSDTGDFVAFSYSPVDSLNDIVKTPQQAKDDLQKIFEIVPEKKIGFFEIGWSTSDFVGGSQESQKEFLEILFEFYSENESDIEFLNWYRQYDRPEGTCVTESQEVGDTSISVGGDSGLGSSEFVIERLNHYICNSGLLDTEGNPKSGWTEFKNQLNSNN